MKESTYCTPIPALTCPYMPELELPSTHSCCYEFIPDILPFTPSGSVSLCSTGLNRSRRFGLSSPAPSHICPAPVAGLEVQYVD
jgi:hypothetical protein